MEKEKHISYPIKLIYTVFGIIFFGLGIIGTVIPLIPTTPLILLSAVCFAKSSQKLHTWCISTNFYRNNAESFITKRSMTIKSKLTLLSVITLIMGLSFITMITFQTPLPIRIILAAIWLCHMIYFGFIIKTIQQ